MKLSVEAFLKLYDEKMALHERMLKEKGGIDITVKLEKLIKTK